MFYNSTIHVHQLSNVIMAQPSGIELMQSDKIYTLIIVIFCYFFVRELVICGKHVYKNWDRLEFANLKQFTEVVQCIINTLCLCTLFQLTRTKRLQFPWLDNSVLLLPVPEIDALCYPIHILYGNFDGLLPVLLDTWRGN